MLRTIRLCVFDRSASPEDSLAVALHSLTDVQVVDTCDSWDALQDHLRLRDIDGVVVVLDAEEVAAGFLIVQRIAEVAPRCTIVGVCGDNRPDAIIRAMRAGCSQFVTMPVDVNDLHQALDRIRQANRPEAESPKRYALVGAAGGVGTTTIACNLAREIAELQHYTVGLVDMNMEFADVACQFDCTPDFGVPDVCRPGVEIDRTLLESAMNHLSSNVSILSRADRPNQARAVHSQQVETLFHVLAEMYPFVIVDLPRDFSDATVAAMLHADRVLVVSQLAVPYLRNATKLYEHMTHLGVPPDRIEIVLNRSNANYERIKPEEVEQHFGKPVFAIIPNDYKRIMSARDLGHPIIAESPNSPARLAIRELGVKLIARGSPAASGASENSGGLLGRFLGRKRQKV